MDSTSLITPIFILNDNNIKLLKQSDNIKVKFNKDLQISKKFLKQYSSTPETIRSYTKEIERLLLWCIHLAKINLTEIQEKHLISYQKFLKNPKPKNIWCGSARSKQDPNNKINPKWRLFVGKLRISSIIKIYKILMIFFKYLVNQKYIIHDFVNKIHVPKKSNNKNNSNYLELSEIQAILTALSNLQLTNQQHAFELNRAKYIVLLLFHTGLSNAEIIINNMNNFVKHKQKWFLRLSNQKLLAINPSLVKAWQSFKATINNPTPLANNHQIPLIPNKDLKTPIKAKRINQIVKWALDLGALNFEPHNLKIAFKLRKASTKWLRNSYTKFNL